ncbi:MAG: hypothetical protein GXY03_15900 [Solirubrobacterales bacterium]|nr:hypothetical protein [Solirubrobacterales bacterium]
MATVVAIDVVADPRGELVLARLRELAAPHDIGIESGTCGCLLAADIGGSTGGLADLLDAMIAEAADGLEPACRDSVRVMRAVDPGA